MMLGGLREGGADGVRLGLTGLGWVGLVEGMRRVGLAEVREVGAGVGTAGVFAVICECGVDEFGFGVVTDLLA